MTNVQEETALRVTRRFSAARDRVFDAWVNEDVLKRWWAGGPGWETPLAEVDARPGGSYRLEMRTPDGDVHAVHGEYSEVRPPERLAYTWQWEGMDEVSQVVVDFVEHGGETEVVIVHTGLADPAWREQHVQGWNAVLDTLERNVFS